jgi:hypothetical protein
MRSAGYRAQSDCAEERDLRDHVTFRAAHDLPPNISERLSYFTNERLSTATRAFECPCGFGHCRPELRSLVRGPEVS